VYASLISLLENLVVDVEHSFKSFSYQVSQSQITRYDRVVLTGGTANLRNLENFLSDRLGAPVDRVNPFSSLRVNAAVRNLRKDFLSDASVFASAAGLALSQVLEKAKPFNLIAADKKKAPPRPAAAGRPFRMKPVPVAVLVLAAAAAIVAPQIGRLNHAKAEAQRMSAEVKKAKAGLSESQTQQLKLAEEEKDLTGERGDTQSKLRLFKQSARGKREFSQVLAKLASLMPEDVWITKLSYAGRKLTVVGSTSKTELVANFIENLKKPDDFSDVTFSYTQRDANTSVFSFEILMNVR
jgi:Tfp pilus assembly protein PilN